MDSSTSIASSHARIIYHLYGFLGISSALSRSLKKNIVDHLTNSVRFILFRRVSLLKFWRYSFIITYKISISMAPSEVIYERKCRRRPGPEILYRHLGVTRSYLYLDWYNPCPYPFLCSFSPYRNFEDEIFVRRVE